MINPRSKIQEGSLTFYYDDFFSDNKEEKWNGVRIATRPKGKKQIELGYGCVTDSPSDYTSEYFSIMKEHKFDPLRGRLAHLNFKT